VVILSNLIKYVKNNANKDFSEMKFNEVDAAIYTILPYLDLMGLINTPITIKELYDKFSKRFILKDKDKDKFMEENKEEKNFIKIIKGSLIAIILTIIMLLIFSVILTYTNVKESTSTPVIFGIMIISIIIGSIISVRKVKKNGLVNGAIVGGIYILTIYILSSVFATTFGLNLQAILMIIFAILIVFSVLTNMKPKEETN